MKRSPPILRALSTFAIIFWLLSAAQGADWPQWRGPLGDGCSAEQALPTHWSTTENIAWKLELPEAGNSTPIVWQDKIFLTQPRMQGNRRTLLCVARDDGRILWERGVEWAEVDPTHKTNPLCSSSPVTDGKRVIAWFGSAGIVCYDLEGNQLWRQDLGIQNHIWGYGSSPIIHGNMCYLNFGPGERSFLVALDLETGAIVWTHDEPINTQGTAEAPFTNSDFYGSWSTPVVASIAGREQIVISFPFRVCGLDPRDGKMLWSSDGLNALVYTSPLIDKETVVSMGGYSGMSLGLRVGHSGAVPPISRLWHHPKTKQRIGSGVVHQGHIYIHNSTGIAECFELETGRLVWEQRLAGKGGSNTNWSSIMTAAGLCYTITQGGDCFVFRASPNFELVAMNALGESSNSSVVPSDGQLFIRTHQHLWCVGLPALNR